MQQGNSLKTTTTVIHIKNMVANSCMRIVREDLQKTGFIEVLFLDLGQATIRYDSQVMSLEIINTILKQSGFELIIDNNANLVEQIKTAIIQFVYYGNNSNSLIRNSDYLSEKLGHSYQYLSKVFSEKTGTTLEKYIILVKMERIKEMISYEQLTLSEIAHMMGYSSVQYLSNQFKQITSYTVSEYKNLAHKKRIPLSGLLD